MTDATGLSPEQLDAFPYGDLDKFHYLGELHWYAFYNCTDSCPGEWKHGIIQPHYNVEYNYWCGGGVTFAGHSFGTTWDVESYEPLTISPSLLCRAHVRVNGEATMTECGDHGFIRNGMWVKA